MFQMNNKQISKRKGKTIINLGMLEIKTNMIRKHVFNTLKKKPAINHKDVLWALKKKLDSLAPTIPIDGILCKEGHKPGFIVLQDDPFLYLGCRAYTRNESAQSERGEK